MIKYIAKQSKHVMAEDLEEMNCYRVVQPSGMSCSKFLVTIKVNKVSKRIYILAFRVGEIVPYCYTFEEFDDVFKVKKINSIDWNLELQIKT